MEYDLGWLVLPALLGGVIALCGLLKGANEWFYVSSLGEKKYSLPPGDMGWPFIGNMLSFLKAFKYGDPDSFISNFSTRFGKTQIYKAFVFGNPTIIVTKLEICRRVLMDDENFGPGWPKSIQALVGKALYRLCTVEHKRLRRLTVSTINGDVALSLYVKYIEDIVVNSLDEWAAMDKPIEFVNEMRKIALKVMMDIIMSGDIDPKALQTLEKEYYLLSHGLKAMPINLPGFAYHKAFKARKKFVKILEAVVAKRRMMKKLNQERAKKDMMDLMMEVEDEDGWKLSDEEIIDIMLIYLLAGHESSSHAITWAVIYLQQHPQVFQKAKEEQEEVVRRRPSTVQTGLTMNEIKQMQYLHKVIDETLRMTNISFALHREAKTDININGYTIPKGWKVVPWIRSIHVDPEIYPNSKEFNPSRWDGHTKLGTFIPFGVGRRLCPGADLAKLEISIFLHYFLLDYKLEMLNPGCGIKSLPIPKPADNCLARIKKEVSSSSI